MKTLAIIITSWSAINLLAIIMNILFSNTITATISILVGLATGAYIAIKTIWEL